MVKVVIEHLEPWLSKWLWIEYAHASKLLEGRVEFTNVKKSSHRETLSVIGSSVKESALELYPHEELIILDPRAEEPLKPEDLGSSTVLLIGGILGSHPPRGRTWKLLTSKAPRARARNLGREQFTIDGSAYLALKVAQGFKLNELHIRRGLVVKAPPVTIYLPYAYPLDNGKPVVSRQLLKYLKHEIVEDEEKLLREGKTREVVKAKEEVSES